jgi:hypothetical protein
MLNNGLERLVLLAKTGKDGSAVRLLVLEGECMAAGREFIGRTVGEAKRLLPASLTRHDNVNRLLAKNSAPALSGLRHETGA